jgi:hypothetical protein
MIWLKIIFLTTQETSVQHPVNSESLKTDNMPVIKTPKDPSKIPHGYFCYIFEDRFVDGVLKIKYACPYWKRIQGKPEQENGYCGFMELGDWMENGTMLLWDGCKECNVNLGEKEE